MTVHWLSSKLGAKDLDLSGLQLSPSSHRFRQLGIKVLLDALKNGGALHPARLIIGIGNMLGQIDKYKSPSEWII
jgi:hypothetical protein